MRFFRINNRAGFTLIELMIVMSIVGILASIAAPNYRWGLIKAREAVLRENLYTFRSTIDQFYADRGKFPEGRQELQKEGYLRVMPKDPFTGQDDWVELAPPPSPSGEPVSGTLYDVKSASPLKGSNGIPYNEW